MIGCPECWSIVTWIFRVGVTGPIGFYPVLRRIRCAFTVIIFAPTSPDHLLGTKINDGGRTMKKILTVLSVLPTRKLLQNPGNLNAPTWKVQVTLLAVANLGDQELFVSNQNDIKSERTGPEEIFSAFTVPRCCDETCRVRRRHASSSFPSSICLGDLAAAVWLHPHTCQRKRWPTLESTLPMLPSPTLVAGLTHSGWEVPGDLNTDWKRRAES